MPLLEDGTRSRRTRFETVYEILRLCVTPTKKTRVMYHANLSHAQLLKYLSFSTRFGLLTVGPQGCVTTEKGRSFMDAYERLVSLTEGIQNAKPPQAGRHGN